MTLSLTQELKVGETVKSTRQRYFPASPTGGKRNRVCPAFLQLQQKQNSFKKGGKDGKDSKSW